MPRTNRSPRSVSQHSQSTITNSQTSVIYVQDKKQFSNMAKFIKRLGDERVSCQVMIAVKQFMIKGGAPQGDSSAEVVGQEKLFAL